MRFVLDPTKRALMHSAARPLQVGSLRTRLLLLVLVSMLPILFLTLYRARLDHLATRTQIQQESLRFAQYMSNDVEQLLAATRELLAAVAALRFSQPQDRLDAERQLANMVRQNPLYTSLNISDTQGNVLLSSSQLTVPVTVADRPWFKQVVQTRQFTVGDFQIGRLTGRAMFSVSLPVLNPNDQSLVAVAVAGLDLSRLQSILKRLVTQPDRPAVSAGLVTSLTDRKGTILARYPGDENIIGRTLADPLLNEAVLTRGEGFAVGLDPDGETQIYAFTQVKSAQGHLYIASGVPTATAYADVRQALIADLFWLAVVALFALLLAWSVGTVFILYPIADLTHLTTRLTSGDLTARSGVEQGAGELHDLAQAIDRMAEKLEKRESERQEAVAALRESEQKYREIFDLSPEAIVVLSRDARLLDTNNRVVEWLGYEKAPLLGKSLLELDLVAPGSRATMQAAFAKRAAGEQMPPYELTFVTRNGEHRIGRVIGTPLVENGSVIGDLVMISDITEAKLADQRMQALEKRAQQGEKLESLRVMAAGIAHDFNNLLQAIVGNAEIAEFSLPADAKVQTELREIQRAAVRATRLTHQMLDYSGSGTLRTAPLQLTSFITARRDTFTAATGPGVRLVFALASDLPAIQANQAQIEQAVLNLVLNAAEAIGDGKHGTVTVTTGCQAVTSQFLADAALGEDKPEGNYVFVEITDTGCGMTDAVRARLFEPFFTTKFTGRGLGLASVLGIMRGHRGAIKVTTRPGTGSSFRLLFPASVAASREDVSADNPRTTTILRAPPPAAASTRNRPAVLLVDDEEGLRLMGQRILERDGFRVFTAADGEEALELFRRESAAIGLVILDLTMPRLDGVQTCRALKRLQANLRVVISSGFSEEQARDQIPDNGIAGFLQKPYTVDTLVSMVRTHLPMAQ